MLSYSFLVVTLVVYRASSSPQGLPGYGGGGFNDGGGGGGGGGGGDYDYSLEDAIPGTPGVDYPIQAEVPDTGFSCDGRVSRIYRHR